MGFLNDLMRGAQKAKQAYDATQKVAAQQQAAAQARQAEKESQAADWADLNDYDPPPPLRLRRWGVFDGSQPGTGGLGFEMPDGKWVHSDRLGVMRWKAYGIFVGLCVGGSFRIEEISDQRFDWGQTLRFVAEPDNPHSENGSSIAIKSWDDTLKAGYIPNDLTQKVRKLADGGDFSVISLNGKFAWPDDNPAAGALVRPYLVWAMFRPGRIEGTENVPTCPPIAPPREPYPKKTRKKKPESNEGGTKE